MEMLKITKYQGKVGQKLSWVGDYPSNLLPLSQLSEMLTNRDLKPAQPACQTVVFLLFIKCFLWAREGGGAVSGSS